jgi:hypothetical protein
LLSSCSFRGMVVGFQTSSVTVFTVNSINKGKGFSIPTGHIFCSYYVRTEDAEFRIHCQNNFILYVCWAFS